MDLDLIYKIVCEKGMNIHMGPADTEDRDTIFICLTKGKKKINTLVPVQILSIYSDPQSVFENNVISMMAEALEEETDDGSV